MQMTKVNKPCSKVPRCFSERIKTSTLSYLSLFYADQQTLISGKFDNEPLTFTNGYNIVQESYLAHVFFEFLS